MKKTKKSKAKKVKKVQSKTTRVLIQIEQKPALPVVRESDLLPEKDGGKYRVVQSWLSEKQVLRMIQKTPPNLVFKRKGKGGQTFDYIPGWYFKKALNFAFGWNWDFRITHQQIVGEIGKQGTQIVTTGQLTVKDDKGHQITKEDNGKSDVKYLKNSTTPMDIGNDFKASATDALKRCAVQLGIGADIYGKAELKVEADVDVAEAPRQADSTPNQATPALPAPSQELFCLGNTGKGCPHGSDITPEEHSYSMKIYKKPLCRKCQEDAKPWRKNETKK